ncbi:LysM peptidoglycan-binding domain-containing M23 family metallopeptidase [Methylocystis sp. WRRC1]|uniref:peptidoglycan DD-metalloendopeptidase family protein n=1 Tax=Methylocystis sp. WRRC1 TaxID=1732014 RepID=UPI001D15CDEF|nr:peptidoglycan DD-metalloendopeptidase family protein [Methylocystis sp. WRRC1]MCC3247291.1 LysM peptidoglycan-binding domain-containing M23 family metallopeptidase [Methylocystis sp. WRRC1]
MAVGTAALMAGCSDASRLADPFSNPFGDSPKIASSRSIDRAPTGAIGSAPARSMAPVRVESQPLPAPGAVKTASAAPAPAPAPAAPGSAGGSHWVADGGTPVTVAQGETAGMLATRYGVPTDALLRANGFSTAAQVQPGTRIVIPVYRANAVAHSAPAAPAPVAAPKVAETKPEPVKTASREDQLKAEKAKAAAAKEEAAKAEKAKAAAAKEEAAKAEKARLAAKEEAAKAEKAKAAARAEELKAEKAKAAAKEEEARRAKKAAELKAAEEAKIAKAEARKAAEAKTAEAKKAAEAKAAEAKAAAEKAKLAKAEAAKAEKAARAERLAKSAPSPRVEEKSATVSEPVVAKSAEKQETKTAAVEKPTEPAASKTVDKTTTASIPPAAAAAPAPAAPAQDQKTVASDDGRPEFRWPARGRIIQGFSSGGNDGINIAVPEGTQVKAAEGGVVAYAGSELKGYGNLVLIRHPNGFVSAYAHNGELEVKRGDQVKRGQTIAKSGQSGNVGSPQLHFELRKGSTPVDPTSYLAGL